MKKSLLSGCFLLYLAAVAHVGAQAPAYALGENIEVSTTGAWDKATIIEVGVPGSEHEGEYKVHFPGYADSYDRWLRPIYFRKVAPGAGAPAAPAVVYQMGERIEVSTTGAWDKATIIGVGVAGGEHEGEFQVHFDGYSAAYDRWLRPIYFRKVAGGAPVAPVAPAAPFPGGTTGEPAAPHPAVPAAEAGEGPRLGKFNIWSYGATGNPPLFLGHIELLGGGKYRISNTAAAEYYGEGTYAFDAAGATVRWLSGPCSDNGWTGTFTAENGGKLHKIRLKSSTIATNTLE